MQSHSLLDHQFEMLLQICPEYLPLFIIGIIVAIASRNFLMKKEIERVENISLWNTLPLDKRKALFIVATKNRPSDMNNFDEYVTRYVHHPTKLAGLIAYGIGNVIHTHLRDDEKYYIMLALTMFIIGGIGINGTRHGGSIMLDCIFRVVFGTAFVAILHYLSEASDIVMIKSI